MPRIVTVILIYHHKPIKNGVSGMLCCVLLVRTDVLEELSASCIRVTRIDELGTAIAVTNN
jgi:hypothetical protein